MSGVTLAGLTVMQAHMHDGVSHRAPALQVPLIGVREPLRPHLATDILPPVKGLGVPVHMSASPTCMMANAIMHVCLHDSQSS